MLLVKIDLQVSIHRVIMFKCVLLGEILILKKPWNQLKPSSKIFLLMVPRRCFFCGSIMLYMSCFCYAFVFVCLLMPCGHLLGKGWPLGSRLWCLIVKLSLSHWYPGSGVVLACIDSWSLPFYLLILQANIKREQYASKLSPQCPCYYISEFYSFT